MAGVRQGTFTCVGWQVTLCDPIWQVTSRSSEVGIPQEELYQPLPYYRPKWQAYMGAMLKGWKAKWVQMSENSQWISDGPVGCRAGAAGRLHSVWSQWRNYWQRRPRNAGGPAGLRGHKIMALFFFTVNLTQQVCADVHWHSFVATVEISRIHTTWNFTSSADEGNQKLLLPDAFSGL